MADPQALVQALAGWETYERLGSPEGELAIAQVGALSRHRAEIERALRRARRSATRAARDTGSLMPPAHILNAPTRLMKQLGYGAGYAYDHEAEDAFSGQNYFPDGMARQAFYRPRERGFEREVAKRLAYWAKLRDDRNGGATATHERHHARGRRGRGRASASTAGSAAISPALTQGVIQKLCRTGQVRVDGHRAEAATRLAPGQSVRIPPLPVARRLAHAGPGAGRARPARAGAHGALSGRAR